MKKAILIGRINIGGNPVGGETAKNQYLIEVLGNYCTVLPLDFYRNKQHPWIFLKAVFTLCTHPNATLILSTTASNVYGFIKLMLRINPKRRIIHWIIGGEFGRLVKDGKFDAKVFNSIIWNLAESEGMVKTLKECGIQNALYVSNFKKIPYYPELMKAENRRNPGVFRFVYLGRIMKSKGVDILLDVISKLDNNGYQDKFTLDLYGNMDASYEKEFLDAVGKLSNVKYNGPLNLRVKEGYDTLANKHILIFPTHHPSEGMAGVFIDAYIAGLPVLTTDWNYNREIVKDGITGLIISPEDEDSLYKILVNIIRNDIDLQPLSLAARKEAEKYKIENVLTSDLFAKLGIL